MATSPKQNELLQLQQEITAEVQRDAPAIAEGVFGDNKNHPDMRQVSNQQIDDLYKQKFLTNDREWLQGEARRDPQQFLAVAQRIGVSMPPAVGAPGGPPPLDPNALAKTVAATPPMPQPTQPPPQLTAQPPLPGFMPPSGPGVPQAL